MELGNIVEYIDNQKIICAVVTEAKKERLRVITETNKEVNLSVSRLLYTSNNRLNVSIGRQKLVEALNEVSERRKALISQINIKELWEVLNSEQEWIDLETMTAFCFPNSATNDHESAVLRAFFTNKIYFKFNSNEFFPNSEEQVQSLISQAEAQERKVRIIEHGGDWLKKALKEKTVAIPEDKLELIKILKSFFLFEKESPHYEIGKAVLARAEIDGEDSLFQALIKLNVWGENENIDIYKHKIPVEFPENIKNYTSQITNSSKDTFFDNKRKDLTNLPLITIDGQATLDFDDAISIEDKVDFYMLGVHIADVGHFVKKGDPLDQESLLRGSSIYMPDQKIPMLPNCLAEDFCSLKEGNLRPAISVMIKLNRFLDIITYEIVPSIIQVKRQLTYYDVNTIADIDKEIILLQDIAKKFRKKRMENAAVQITLPEINIWIKDDGEIILSKINRESPGRMLVSEIMIMANWLMAKFISENNAAAIYRTQIDPKERLYNGEDDNLYRNWMQRKLLHRFILNSRPEHHAGLGLNVYITATSPIRKYFDLITQRQIRALLGYEELYSHDEIEKVIQMLEEPMKHVFTLQFERHKYWKLKYLEQKIGQKEEALVLSRRRNSYVILLTEYMHECTLPLQNNLDLKPQDIIYVTIQRVNARKDLLSVSFAR
ncbi:MAG: RNB domain-containing ribonuclease [Desulfobacterales bacterium]|nr:RNB domain-containing ribonuclease [Desulfobacterales bacterium]MBF0395614.1 RNB domain-containing ribonuclease [Desulfobacterales bacterium]